MTEQKKHPNYEWIVAFAEGKQLQVRDKNGGAWIDFDVERHTGPWNAPGWRAIEWRVKPESRWYRVALHKTDSIGYWTSAVDSLEEENYAESSAKFVRWLTDSIEYDV